MRSSATKVVPDGSVSVTVTSCRGRGTAVEDEDRVVDRVSRGHRLGRALRDEQIGASARSAPAATSAATNAKRMLWQRRMARDSMLPVRA